MHENVTKTQRRNGFHVRQHGSLGPRYELLFETIWHLLANRLHTCIDNQRWKKRGKNEASARLP
jgi:hypothetical protein